MGQKKLTAAIQALTTRTSIAQVEADQAVLVATSPLAGKLAGMIGDMAAAVAAETGWRPVAVKVCVQMPDDSAYEARIEICPDGCGSVSVVPSVLPRLPSAS
jgi:ABC-type amino acid transport substrate-binding protein